MNFSESVFAIIFAIMTLSSNRLLFFFKLLLSGIIGSYLFELLYYDFIIWDIDKYTLENIRIYFNNGTAIRSIFCLLIPYIFFYWILNTLFIYILDKLLNEIYNKYYYDKISNLKRKKMALFLIKNIRKMIKFSYKFEIIKITKKAKEDYLTYEEYSNGLYSFFSISIQIITVWIILDIYNTIPIYILFILFVLLLFIILICIPFVKIFTRDIQRIIYYELNRNK